MPHYEFFCHACKKTFTKILTLVDYEEGRVTCPHCGSHEDIRASFGWVRTLSTFRTSMGFLAWNGGSSERSSQVKNRVVRQYFVFAATLAAAAMGVFPAHAQQSLPVTTQHTKPSVKVVYIGPSSGAKAHAEIVDAGNATAQKLSRAKPTSSSPAKSFPFTWSRW
jgi:putative FmdB family regulatory protein